MAKDAFGNPAKERDEMPFHTPLPNLKNRHCILITEVPVFCAMSNSWQKNVTEMVTIRKVYSVGRTHKEKF